MTLQLRGPVLLDTGPLVAIFNARDEHHRVCVELLDRIDKPIWTTWPVVVEAAWLIDRASAVQTMLAMFERDAFLLADVPQSAVAAIAHTMKRYANLDLQVADASLVWLAEQHGLDVILTLDWTDFSVLRRRDGSSFRVLPEPTD